MAFFRNRTGFYDSHIHFAAKKTITHHLGGMAQVQVKVFQFTRI